MQELDPRDRDLLNTLQADVPLAATPFAIIGQMIDMSEKEVIKRTDRLRKEGHLRQISAAFDPRAFGYRSSLVAARVNEERLESAAGIISSHPGVYRNYRRNHAFNLWFTIAVPPTSRLGLERTVEILGKEAECEVVRLLPALRSFRGASSEPPESGSDESNGSDSVAEAPSGREIEIIKLLQTELPLHPRPFDVLARNAGMSGEELIEAGQEFARKQQMKRYGAVLQLRRSNFSASVMGVWKVDGEQVDRVASIMTAHKAVSQCYLRPTYPDWPFNLFTIVHGRSVDECESVLAELSDQTGVLDMQALFPVREFKRSRVPLFSSDYESWEATRAGGAGKSAAS